MPKAKTIAELPHVTPEMIEQHVRAALGEGQKIGLAIFRLEHNHSLKKTQKQASEGQKDKDWEDRQKYVSGKHADRINH